MKIIYIAGYGRSGSTILDVCLNQHDSVVGLGELSNLFRDWGDVPSDGIWGEVASRLMACPYEIQDAVNATRKLQAFPRFMVSRRDREIYETCWKAVYDVLGAQNEFIVDSSKTTRITLLSPLRLREIGFDVKVVWLKRSLKGVLLSLLKGSNRELEDSGKRVTWCDRLLNFARGCFGAICTAVLTFCAYGRESEVLRYDDFRSDPESSLNDLMLRIDIPNVVYEKGMFDDMDPGIGISGNRARRVERIRLV